MRDERVGLIGIGTLGSLFAGHLLKAFNEVVVFDLARERVADAVALGASAASSAREVGERSTVVVLSLPNPPAVMSALLHEDGLLAGLQRGSLVIDASTIDPPTARRMYDAAAECGIGYLDTPVSGAAPGEAGMYGAEAATLTFMVGGPQEAFARAKPILEAMGGTIVHAGGAGNGQAAKICNNMILGASMIAVSEAFLLADKLGLEAQKLFDIASKSSGQCWSLTSYCPVPGPVPTSPANRAYQPGFTAAMMLKDLALAQDAARSAGLATPLGAQAAALYGLYVGHGNAAEDFSGIIRFLRGE